MAEMERVTLELPAELVRELTAAGQAMMTEVVERGLRDLRVEQALERYRQGGMSFGAAAQMAGLSQADLAVRAYARGMEPPYREETVAEALQ